MLKVVYRLRPETCLSIPMVFKGDDYSETVTMPIPDSLSSNGKHQQIITYIANFVPALVLNRAMSAGFKICDIDLDSLLIQAPDNRPDSVVTGSQWKTFIENAFKNNNYWLLCDRYLRDYNTERRCVQMTGQLPGLIKPIPIDSLYETLRDYAPSEQDTDMPLVFLGIDVGATLIKFQFYKLQGDGTPQGIHLAQIGSAFRTLTPENLVADRNGDVRKNEAIKKFAEHLVRTVQHQLGIDESLMRGKIEANYVKAIGLSWPGPVRSNHITGTSGILKKFGFLSEIKENRIEEILELDLVKALKEEWKKASSSSSEKEDTDKPKLSVSLVNDGNAEGIGLLITQNLKGRNIIHNRLAVVKLGTGTAGAMFENGQLGSGPWEAGKMLLDLGAKPDPGFPKGTTNQYLSTRTMPRLADNAAKKGSKLFRVKELDSIEIGRILEAKEHHFDRGSVEKLREECGLLTLPSQFPLGRLNTEVLRRIRQVGIAATEAELLRVVQMILLKVDLTELEIELNKRIETYGYIRLGEILGIDGSDIKHVVDWPNRRPGVQYQKVSQSLKEAFGIAKKCAETLGKYLGDFIVYLHDTHRIQTVIASGGVLSGDTGNLVRDEALRRVEKYGIKLTLIDKVFTLAKNVSGQNGGKKDYDFGTLGAAAHAASEYLFELKQLGISRIMAELKKLAPNDRVRVFNERVDFQRDKSGISMSPICPTDYSLTSEEIIDFLDKDGVALGFHRALLGRDESATSGSTDGLQREYTRWIVDTER